MTLQHDRQMLKAQQLQYSPRRHNSYNTAPAGFLSVVALIPLRRFTGADMNTRLIKYVPLAGSDLSGTENSLRSRPYFSWITVHDVTSRNVSPIDNHRLCSSLLVAPGVVYNLLLVPS